MIKSVLEEIIITLLLCLVIMVVLGILLYEYVPISKTIPNPVEYKTSDAVKEQLAEADVLDDSKVIMTYEVNASDLANYKKGQNYQPGKANPFAPYSTEGTQVNSNTNNNSNNNTNNNTNNSNTNTTEERFFQNTGTK